LVSRDLPSSRRIAVYTEAIQVDLRVDSQMPVITWKGHDCLPMSPGLTRTGKHQKHEKEEELRTFDVRRRGVIAIGGQ
jgi:hypothetical protein